MTCKEAINLLNKSTYYCAYDAMFDLADDAIQVEVQDREIFRWYEYGTIIAHLEDGYLGISGPIMLFTEYMDYEDLNIPVTYCECEVSGYKPIFSPKK